MSFREDLCDWWRRQNETPMRTEAELRHLGMVSFLHNVPDAFSAQVAQDEANHIASRLQGMLSNLPAEGDKPN